MIDDVNNVTIFIMVIVHKLLHNNVLTIHHIVNLPNKKLTFLTRYVVDNSSV